MGYYTFHTLETDDTTLDDSGAQIDHRHLVEEYLDYPGLFEESAKWYDSDSDMKAYSKKYPNVLFALSGSGEDQGDEWTTYYMNGIMEKAEITISPPSKDFLLNAKSIRAHVPIPE